MIQAKQIAEISEDCQDHSVESKITNKVQQLKQFQEKPPNANNQQQLKKCQLRQNQMEIQPNYQQIQSQRQHNQHLQQKQILQSKFDKLNVNYEEDNQKQQQGIGGHDIPPQMLGNQKINMKQYCLYINTYKQRRLMRFNEQDQFDIGIATLAELVYYCYEQKFITEEMMMKIPHLKLRNIMNFIKKFHSRQLEANDFTEPMFTPFDYRRLSELLIKKGKLKKYTIGQKIYSIPVQLSVYYNYLYSFLDIQYEDLCDQFRSKYNLYWWKVIGQDCEQKLKLLQQQNQRIKKEQEAMKPRIKKKKNDGQDKSNKNRSDKIRKKEEQSSSEDDQDESIGDEKISEIKNLVIGKKGDKRVQQKSEISSIFNSELGFDSSLSCSAAKFEQSNSQEESDLLSDFQGNDEPQQDDQNHKKGRKRISIAPKPASKTKPIRKKACKTRRKGTKTQSNIFGQSEDQSSQNKKQNSGNISYQSQNSMKMSEQQIISIQKFDKHDIFDEFKNQVHSESSESESPQINRRKTRQSSLKSKKLKSEKRNKQSKRSNKSMDEQIKQMQIQKSAEVSRKTRSKKSMTKVFQTDK